MRNGKIIVFVVLAALMAVTGLFLSGCGRNTDPLQLSFYAPSVGYEGDSLDCVLTIPYPLGVGLAVDITVNAGGEDRIKPKTVIIPAGKVYLEFSMEIVDDDIVNVPSPESVTVTASAPGYLSDANVVAVYNEDS